ncbi:pentatricopeptide repeat-containing protein [Tanacetum coccineum]
MLCRLLILSRNAKGVELGFRDEYILILLLWSLAKTVRYVREVHCYVMKRRDMVTGRFVIRNSLNEGGVMYNKYWVSGLRQLGGVFVNDGGCRCYLVEFRWIEGFVIYHSAAIKMFSIFERINNSICVFKELNMWDSAVCNSMISSFTNHLLEENAMQNFVRSLRKNLHSLVVKLGFECDPIVSSSLVEMYSKCGLLNSSKMVFDEMEMKDVISWNSMI